MKFSKGKCEVLLLGRNHPVLYSLSANLLENSFAEEDLGVLVEQLGQQCAPAAEVANSTPGYGGTGGTLPLCSALRRHRWVQCWAPATETGTCWSESNELR